MLRVTLSVGLDCPWVRHLAGAHGARTKLLQCVPRMESKGTSALAAVSGVSGSPEEVAASVRRIPQVEDATFAPSGAGTLLGIVRTRHCPCARTGLAGCHIAHVSSESEGGMRWVLYVEGPEALRSLVARLKERGTPFRLVEVRTLRGERVLSDRQEQILRAALQLGLYDVPRRAGLGDLARLFRVSPRAISEALRRAHRQAVLQVLEGATSDRPASRPHGDGRPSTAP